ncbi:AraC family transcriptional regulator [Bordetella sp. BOR01]|uniref:helix-turn-helix transcriptional regulator n=1 Tax=Bordetella sp. BOR01 TaxID=2854779 RepID=UPI001C471702|nr:AraC family transcriptional regulator [Bordetella sp. BOR01]MBV7486289.1 AraC family transcriptional regulator [Bordetella sp. BOR01]
MLAQAPPAIDPAHLLTPFHVQGPRQNRGITVPPHRHVQGMLLMVREGVSVVHGDEDALAMAPGRIGWIPPGVLHEANWFGQARGLCVYVRADACDRLPARSTVWPASPLVEALLQRLASVPLGGLDRAHTAGMFEVLVAELRLSRQVRLPLPMPRDRRLRELALSLLDQPDDARGIDAWAQRLNMSSRTLMRRFRGETGVTLGQWRQQARLLRALELLAAGKPVTEVALAIGYESVSAFIGSFRNTYGVTPSQYFPRH